MAQHKTSEEAVNPCSAEQAAAKLNARTLSVHDTYAEAHAACLAANRTGVPAFLRDTYFGAPAGKRYHVCRRS